MPHYVYGFSGLAVPDIDAARTFYRETLGLEVTDAEMGQLSLTLPGGG
jgi:catechol 2,3-dioxygenase-like lactoylglutathione lyase family enzyme